MNWVNAETKPPPIGVTIVLLRQGSVVSFGKLVEKITNESGTVMRFNVAGYESNDMGSVNDVTHYYIPKAPDNRAK